jgi:DNA repair exonuclease SbcCD ATPase subunit
MIHIHAIGLQNVGYFQNVKFNIPLGISAVYGLNRSGGKASKNSNGVGKSFLGSIPAEILYEDPIVGEKSDRIKMGVRELEFTNHRNKRILVRREMRGASEKIHVEVDGEDQKLRKLPVAKAFIKKAFPLSQSDYNTYVHIDSRIPHPLVMGSSTERKKFFTSFFPIEKFDTERKLYAAELSTLGKVKAAYQELRAQLLKSKRDLLPPEVLNPLIAKRAGLKTELLRLQAEFTSIQETVRLVEFASTAKEQIAVLNRACADDINEESFATAEADNKWELKKTRADLEEAEAWEQYKRDNAHYTEAFNALSDEAKALIAKEGVKNAREQAAAGSSAYVKAKIAVERTQAVVEAVEKELKRPVPEAVEAPEENEGDLQTLRRAYAHQLEHAEQFAEGKCETCGQIVKIKDPKVLRKRLDSVIEKLDKHQDARVYTEAQSERKKNRLKLKSYSIDLERAKAKLTSSRALAKIDRELRNLPRKPKPFTGKKLQTVVLKRAMDELTERRSLLQYLKPHLDSIIAFLKLRPEDIKAVKGSENLSSRMNEVQEELSEAQAKIALHRTMSERVKEMRTRLSEMKTQLADEDALRLLVKGCEVQKRMAIESISQRLMILVNKYAAAILPENFRFEFDWGTQVSLIVHRKYGNKTLSSDVRKLSGAESVLFTLILVCALLNFVPAHKRCSVLILDEPTARLSKEMTEVFYSMVKILNTLIPSIIIITPKDDHFEGAQNFTIVKRNGVSQVVEGMPHQIKI